MRRAIGLFLLAAAPAAAQAPVPADIVNVHAVAHRRLPNTVADASVSVEVHGRDVAGASRLLAQASQTLLGYLRDAHAERLRTEGTAVEPETQQVKGQPDRITGYTGRNTVSFRTSPGDLPALLAGSLDHGANALQQAGSSPREEEVDHARNELAAEATRTALSQAAAVAQAAGQRVTGVSQIDVDAPSTDEPFRQPAAPMMMRMAARSTPPLPTEAGDTAVTVGVSVKARIGP